MKPKTILAATLATFAAAAAPARSQLDQAIDFAADIYRHLPNYDQRHAPFAPRLAALIARDEAATKASGEVGRLDWMPLCGCQDFAGHYRLTNMRARTGRAGAVTVIVSIVNDKPQTVTLDLVKSGDGWRIADVHHAAAPSLVALLSRPR